MKVFAGLIIHTFLPSSLCISRFAKGQRTVLYWVESHVKMETVGVREEGKPLQGRWRALLWALCQATFGSHLKAREDIVNFLVYDSQKVKGNCKIKCKGYKLTQVYDLLCCCRKTDICMETVPDCWKKISKYTTLWRVFFRSFCDFPTGKTYIMYFILKLIKFIPYWQ